jgi:hypothetical protein
VTNTIRWPIGLLVVIAGIAGPRPVGGQRDVPSMEHLGRGLVVVRASETSVYLGWRLLGTDPADIAFNVYRASGMGGVRLQPNEKAVVSVSSRTRRP